MENKIKKVISAVKIKKAIGWAIIVGICYLLVLVTACGAGEQYCNPVNAITITLTIATIMGIVFGAIFLLMWLFE